MYERLDEFEKPIVDLLLENDPSSVFEQLAANNQQALDLADQNTRGELIIELDDPDFRELATEGLVDEQSNTLRTLNERVQNTPYEQIGYAQLALAQAIGLLEEDREIIRTQASHFDVLADQVALIAPEIKEKAVALADRKKEESAKVANAQIDRIASYLKTRIDTINQMFDEAAATNVGWSIPRFADARTVIVESAPLVKVIDEIPIEPLMQTQEFQELESLKQRHIDAPEASLYIMVYLKEYNGEVVTVDDLVEFLYSDEVIEKTDYAVLRSRVTTILGPMVQGERMQRMLNEDGLTLQYGWRSTIERRGERTILTSRARIYRAVKTADIESLQYSQVIVGDTATEFERPDGLGTPEIVPAEVEKTELVVVDSGIISEKETEAPHIPPAKPRRRRSEATGNKINWTVEFGVEVGKAIETLVADDLMHEDTIRASVASIKSSSRVVGTRTVLERLDAAGILKIENYQSGNGYQDFELTPEVLVTMILFNSNRDIFSNHIMTKRALEIISRAVRRHFDLKQIRTI